MRDAAVDISTRLTVSSPREERRSAGGGGGGGCCGCFSGDTDPATVAAKNRSKSIDAQLRTEKVNAAEDIKLLLLGAGEAGKSTIFKQIQLIHNKGISSGERMAVGEAIHQQVLVGMHMMINFVHDNDLHFKPENESIVSAISAIEPLGFILSADVAGMLRQLWADPAIVTAFERRGEYHLMDSTQYFFDKIVEISKKGWVPSESDVIHARIKTTGISEMSFALRGYRFKVIDVGGQRSERRKWIHCFEDVTAVIFVASLSEYDCMLCEEQTVNRMHESLVLFTEICNSPWFAKTSIILFLNKRDLFAEKIKRVDLNVCFPDYSGGCNEELALEFVKKKFLAANRNPAIKNIYLQVTCATDTDNIKFVFNAVQDIVLQENLRGSGII